MRVRPVFLCRLGMHVGACAVASVLGACGGGSEDPSNASPQASVAAAPAAGGSGPGVAARRALPYNRQGVTAIVVSPNGKQLAVAHSDGRVQLLDASSRTEMTALLVEGRQVTSGLVFSADGRYLVTVGRDSVAQVWNTASGVRTATLSGHEHPLRAVAANADGSVVATAGEETRVMVWNGATGKLKRILSGHTDFVNTVALSADGRWLASGDANARVLVWNVATGQLLNTLRGHSNEINAMAFAPDGRSLVSAGEDGQVIVWDALGGKELYSLQSAGVPVRSIVFSQDGSLVAAGGGDGRVKVWNTLTRAVQQETANSTASINALAFDVKDKNRLLYGDERSSVLSVSVSGQSAR